MYISVENSNTKNGKTKKKEKKKEKKRVEWDSNPALLALRDYT